MVTTKIAMIIITIHIMLFDEDDEFFFDDDGDDVVPMVAGEDMYVSEDGEYI